MVVNGFACIYLLTPFIELVYQNIAVAIKAHPMPVKDSVFILNAFF